MSGNELDEKLYKYYNKMQVPSKFYQIPNRIEDFPMHSRRNYHVWKFSMVCMILLMICTVAFGKSIYLNVLKSMSKVHEGISTAIDNDYYAVIDMEYSKSNKIEIKVSQLLMDDYNLFLGFSIKNNTNHSIDKINFKDMIITDEHNNLIFCDDEKTYEEYCKRSGMEIREISEVNLSDAGYGIETVGQENNNLEILYKLYSSKYPKSRELNIQIHTIELEESKDKVRNKEGIWKMKINIPKEFYERKYINYQVKDGSDTRYGIKIENVVVTNTQTVISYSGKSKTSQSNSGNPEEIINNFISSNASFYDEMKIKNEKGEIFNISSITDAYGTYYSSVEKTFEGRLPFGLTKYNATDKLYLIIIKDGEEKVINLER